MIEIPRAALISDEIAAAGAEFFSFGTNDLTQMTFDHSRDDVSGRTRPPTWSRASRDGPLPGAGRGWTSAAHRHVLEPRRHHRRAPDLKVGICGEHGGDPASVDFFHRQNLDYVSCSPFRVPIARLAAAQAALKERSA